MSYTLKADSTVLVSKQKSGQPVAGDTLLTARWSLVGDTVKMISVKLGRDGLGATPPSVRAAIVAMPVKTSPIIIKFKDNRPAMLVDGETNNDGEPLYLYRVTR